MTQRIQKFLCTLVVLLLAIFAVFFAAPKPISAEVDTAYPYLEIGEGGATLTTDGGFSVKLPAGYFVEVTSDANSATYSVKFAGLSGTVPKTELLDGYYGFDPAKGGSPFYTASGNVGALTAIIPDPNSMNDAKFLSTAHPVTVYGTASGSVGDVYFVTGTDSASEPVSGYILQTAFAGYAPATDFPYDNSLTPRPTTAPPVGGGEDTDNPPANPTQTEFVKIVLIIVISVLAVAVVFIIFKPVRGRRPRQAVNRQKRRSSRYEYEDDNDL